jgi:hypothetical protein
MKYLALIPSLGKKNSLSKKNYLISLTQSRTLESFPYLISALTIIIELSFSHDRLTSNSLSVNSSFLSVVISLTDESWAASVNSHLSRLSHQIPITEPQIPIPFTESQITIPNCRIKAHWTLNLNLVKRKYGLLKLSRHKWKLSLVFVSLRLKT